MENAPAANVPEQDSGEAYDPLQAIDRDFRRLQQGEWPLNPETRTMAFYRQWISAGNLLVLGCGSNHLHYSLALADKVSHITALDIALPNLDVIRQLLDAAAGNQHGRPYVILEHLAGLNDVAEPMLRTSEFGPGSASDRVRETVERHRLPDGSWDLVQADMFDLAELPIGPFDSVLMGHSLYAPRHTDPFDSFTCLLSCIKGKLTPGGRFILCDLPDFDDSDLVGNLKEAPGISNTFTCEFNFDVDFFRRALEAAGLDALHLAEEVTGSVLERQIYVVAAKPQLPQQQSN